MYGDAADVYIDNGSGRMADLNHDGRVDSRDARVRSRNGWKEWQLVALGQPAPFDGSKADDGETPCFASALA